MTKRNPPYCDVRYTLTSLGYAATDSRQSVDTLTPRGQRSRSIPYSLTDAGRTAVRTDENASAAVTETR